MPNQTTNYSLKKPLENEYVDIGLLNENMDKIDAALAPTADPAQVPAGLTGKLSQWVSWITNRIKAITGGSNWYDAPATTLQAANTHHNAAAPHTGHETPAGAQSKVEALAGSGNTKTVKQVDDAVTAHLADYVRQPGYGTTAGNTNTYALTLSPALASYVAGVCVAVKIHAANTGASTINVNGLGAKTILDSKGAALTSGKLKLNVVYTLRYDGTNFILQGDGGDYGNVTADKVLAGTNFGTDNGISAGTMPDRNGVNTAAYGISTETGRLYMKPLTGYYDQTGPTSWVYKDDVNFSAANIKNGVNIFGLVGTHPNISTGTAAPSGGYDNDYYIQT